MLVVMSGVKVLEVVVVFVVVVLVRGEDACPELIVPTLREIRDAIMDPSSYTGVCVCVCVVAVLYV